MTIGHQAGKSADKLPYRGVIRVENVSAVPVDRDAGQGLRADAAADMRPLVDDQDLLSGFPGAPGKDGAGKPGAFYLTSPPSSAR